MSQEKNFLISVLYIFSFLTVTGFNKIVAQEAVQSPDTTRIIPSGCSWIAAFCGDGLVKALLRLKKGINENAISATLKNLGQSGPRKRQMLLLSKNAQWLSESGLESITLDVDSTVKSVCGHQQGAEKGYNTTKQGAKSYHPLLIFVSEIRLLYHTWFRTGSAYTANGIVDFLKDVKASLLGSIKKVFFRADSGFFSGALFDLPET